MYNYFSRTICDVLEAMRVTHKLHNYSYLLALIEEAQEMATRMENALDLQKDLQEGRKEHKKLKKEIVELEESKEKLEKKAE